MIALDLDGTLLGADGRVSARNLTALLAAEEAGIYVAIATGRRHCYAMRVLRGLNLHSHAALVSSNGTVIRTLDAQLLHRTHMPLEAARWLLTHLGDFRNSVVLTFDTVLPNGEERGRALLPTQDEPRHINELLFLLLSLLLRHNHH